MAKKLMPSTTAIYSRLKKIVSDQRMVLGIVDARITENKAMYSSILDGLKTNSDLIEMPEDEIAFVNLLNALITKLSPLIDPLRKVSETIEITSDTIAALL